MLPLERVASLLKSQTRGFFGLGQEQTIGTWLVWYPFHLFEIACSRPERQRFRKPTVKTRTVWNLYEALTGSHFTGWGVAPETVEVSMASSIRPLVKDSVIASEIRKTHNRLLEVVTSSAFERYRAKMLALGIDPSVTAISIESRLEVYVPFHISLLQARGGERFVAVDGCWGRVWESMGSVLTSTKGYVLGAIGQIAQSPPTRGG
jgi:hypothetical protein